MPKFRFAFTVSLVCLSLLFSCTKKEKQANGYFDSLIVADIGHLTKNKALLNKYSRMDEKKDSAFFQPDSLGWLAELDVFRQLDAFQKPAFRDHYQVQDGLRDSLSNLTIRQYKAIRPVAIPYVRFYYYQQFEKLKKIEALYLENNTLYAATRHLTMEFDEINGKAILTRYSLEGIQRMILSDSINYSIRSSIQFKD